MCNTCVKEEFPDRESVCLDSGSYMLNFAGCAQCGEKCCLSTVNRQTSEDDSEEVITYQHICQTCNHVIANHEHVFKIEEDFQAYQLGVRGAIRILFLYFFFGLTWYSGFFFILVVVSRFVYEMMCLLCGRSDDQRSIMPCDPRGPKPEHSDFD